MAPAVAIKRAGTPAASRMLATPAEIRKRITALTDLFWRSFFSCAYITGARVSELVGTYGLTRKRIREATHQNERIVVFEILTAKRGRQTRLVAVPLNLRYEPLCWAVLEHVRQFSGGDEAPLWDISRFTAVKKAREVFAGLEYMIEPYWREGKKIPRHARACGLHALRHIRATELVEHYGFDMMDVAIFMGWDLSRFGPSVATRYLYLQWPRYIGKLFREPPG